MSTENLPKKPTTTSHLKKLNTGGIQPQAASSENVIEQVPQWLRQLLTKYGEREGRLVGLGEGYSSTTPTPEPAEADETGLSALLEQMAEEGMPQSSSTRRSTSVEWGNYQPEAEPESPGIDDLLTNLRPEPAAYNPAPDWLTDMQSEADQPEPEYPHSSTAAPEWLNDMIQQEERISPQAPSSSATQDVPDWLTNALEMPAKAPIPPTPPRTTPTTPPQTKSQDYDVPDWLNEALDTPKDSSRVPATSKPLPPSSNVPDWLAEPTRPENYQGPATPTSADYPAAIEVPDWLESIASPPSERQTLLDQDENASTIEVPDWLTNIAPPTTGQTESPQDWQMPDWMATDTAGQTKPGSSADWSSPGEADQALPSLDWLFQGEDTSSEAASMSEPAGTDPNWMFNLPNELTPDSSAASAEIPDWLSELPGTEQGAGEIPDWFKDVPLPPVESTTDDWLADLHLSTDSPAIPTQSLAAMDLADEDSSTWLDTNQQPPTSTPPLNEVKSVSRYKRLKPQETSTPPIEPADLPASAAPTEPETSTPPQWASESVFPDTSVASTSIEPPLSGFPSGMPTADTTAPEPSDWLSAFANDTDLTPDWLTDSAETSSADWLSTENPTEENDLLAQRLDWFTQGSSEEIAPEPAGISTNQSDDSDWLTERQLPTLPKAAEPAPFDNIVPAESQPDDLDWLRDLPTPTSQEDIAETIPDQSEADIPPWLANLPNLSAPETPLDTPGEAIEYPAWLTESSTAAPGETQIQEEVEANIPSWLMGLSTSEAETSTWLTGTEPTLAEETPADLTSSSWLTDLSSDEPADQTDTEVPSWLTQLSAPDSETLPWSNEAIDETVETSETALEPPTWLGDLEPMPPVTPAIETDGELPSWLTELSNVDTTGTDQFPAVQTEVPGDNLAWLNDTTKTPTVETPAEDTDIPTWWSNLSTATGETETEIEAETPSWLTTAPAADQETPPWLTTSPEPPLAGGFSTEPDEAESLEIPDWLTALSTDAPVPEDSEPEAEIPPWLTELTGETGSISEDEPLTWSTEASSDVETETDFETPPWLTELAPEEVPASKLAELHEAEPDIPAWFDELPEAPTTRSVVAEEPTEIPAWLNDLSEIAAPNLSTETETPTWPTQMAEPEIPAWLSEPSAISETQSQSEIEPETPSWLSELPPVEEETPSWLINATPVTEETSETPAWLTTVEEEPTATSTSEAELEVPDWLTDSIETAPADSSTTSETPAWYTELAEPPVSETTPQPQEVELELETPDWLAEMSQPPAAESAPRTITSEEPETPLWLAEPTEIATSATIAVDEEELEIPTWLWDLPPEKRDLLEADLSGTLPGPEPTAEVEASLWSSEPTPSNNFISETEAEVPSPSAEIPDIPAEAELPAWLIDLSEPTTATEISGALDKVEQKSAEPPLQNELSSEIPAWLNELAPTSATEVSEEPDQEIPSWLADSTEESTSTLPSETDEELVIPAWLGKSAVDTQAVVDEELETPGWLTELVETSPPEPPLSQGEPELETPSWLKDLTQASEVEVETTDIPSLPEVETVGSETEANDEITIPSWLTSSFTAASAVTTPFAAPLAGAEESAEPSEFEASTSKRQLDDIETPAWLAELPQASSLEEPSPSQESAVPAWLDELGETAPAETEPESEPDMPDWLADLRATQTASLETATPAWLVDQTEPSAQDMTVDSEVEPAQELPDWLAELSPKATPIAEPTEELVIPAWLNQSAEAELAEEPTFEEPAEDLVIPAWLNASPEPVTDDTLTAEEEEELVFPSWLNRTPSTAESEETQAEAAPPSWLTELPETSPALTEEPDIPSWLSELSEETTEEAETPAWLADLATTEQVETPTWLTESEEESPSAELLETTEPEAIEGMPAWLSSMSTQTDKEISAERPEVETLKAEMEATETPLKAVEPAVSSAETQTDDAMSMPDWLAGLGDAPEWPKGEQPEAEAVADNFLAFEEEPEAPDWLKDEPQSPLPSATSGRPKTGPLQLPGEAKTSSSVERMSEWLRNLQPIETPVETEEAEPRETTGMLTGLAPLLPAEKIGPVTPTLDSPATATTADSDAVLEAAQHFYTIATQAPQPAALPELPTKREGLIRRWLRALFHLVFIGLIALPLFPGLQKTVNGQKVPWTEPAGELSEVLDRQRRELTSAQLGVIDLQQPGSVALVSLDYSTATQGEMEPLAEAVISRLRGQGMRLIFVSLEPEGAALAQRTLDRILTERNETYGTDIVNLGYIPGQVAGIRELVSGHQQLAGMADFKNGLTFAAAERANWKTVTNLGQIDVVITLADNPATARWWIEQMATAIPPDDGQRYLLAATSALADPLIRPYLSSGQLDGLLSGLNGAAAIEAGRKNFGPARRMLDSQGVAHLTMVILIAAGTMAGWMPDQKDQA